LLSLHWTRALRPASLARSYLRCRRGFGTIAAAARPFAAAIDTIAARAGGSQFRQARPATDASALDVDAVIAHAPSLAGGDTLAVDHDLRDYAWLIERAGRRAGGRMLSALVRRGPTVLGWYVAHLDDEGGADVAQLAASRATIADVLDQLFHEAWRHGAVSVNGRVDGRFLQALSDKYCLFHRRGPWMLVRSRTPELLQAFLTGATSFSRLDGEWSLRFQS
jgi:hypothetical protein